MELNLYWKCIHVLQLAIGMRLMEIQIDNSEGIIVTVILLPTVTLLFRNDYPFTYILSICSYIHITLYIHSTLIVELLLELSDYYTSSIFSWL
jgi:hypothetical protein